MGNENPTSTSHDERIKRHIQVLYARQTRERQTFMQELTEYRKKKEKEMFKIVKQAVGPRWYHALSVPQRLALDNLAVSVYQDNLEGRPHRTANVMRALGLYPRPSKKNLMNCICQSKHNGMEMLAQLYQVSYGSSIEMGRSVYCLNAKLILSAILYLGMNDLIRLLKEKFRPDVLYGEPSPKPKPKPEPPLASPYLQTMVAAMWEKPVYKRPPPPPLPNLDDLNDPYEEELKEKRPAPPPPPPPPPKKRIPRETCDALAGVYRIEPCESPVNYVAKRPMKTSRKRQSKSSLIEGKKVFGLGLGTKEKNKKHRKKPVAPKTATSNTQYMINGVYEINGKAVYILGNITVEPAKGDLIHGGYASVLNEVVNIHCGFRGLAPPPKQDICDCQKRWHETVFKYIKRTKCYCGHHYDFGNEGPFPPDELPFFVKPTRHTTMQFNYQTILNIDAKGLHVEKEFKKIWETDSILQPEDGTVLVKKDKDKKKKKERSSTCLGADPVPEDYLKCALRFMRRLNVAARLPDLHLVPELKAWMRRRMYGPLKRQEKEDLLRKSNTYWAFFAKLASKNFGRVAVPREKQYTGLTTWLEKQKLNDSFKKFTLQYKLALFRSYAKITNLFWRTMFQAEIPDKTFRQIYFSYLFSRMEDMQMIPYVSELVRERAHKLRICRYVCLPAGAEDREG